MDIQRPFHRLIAPAFALGLALGPARASHALLIGDLAGLDDVPAAGDEGLGVDVLFTATIEMIFSESGTPSLALSLDSFAGPSDFGFVAAYTPGQLANFDLIIDETGHITFRFDPDTSVVPTPLQAFVDSIFTEIAIIANPGIGGFAAVDTLKTFTHSGNKNVGLPLNPLFNPVDDVIAADSDPETGPPMGLLIDELDEGVSEENRTQFIRLDIDAVFDAFLIDQIGQENQLAQDEENLSPTGPSITIIGYGILVPTPGSVGLAALAGLMCCARPVNRGRRRGC